MATDFKLKVGLDIPASTKEINQDISTLQDKLKNKPLSINAGVDFKVTQVRAALNKAIEQSKSGLNATATVKFTKIQQSLNQAVSELKQIPVVKVAVDVDKTSINRVMNKIAKELKLDFTPQKGTGSTSTQKMAADINAAAKETEKLHREFQKVGTSATSSINGMSESLRKFGALQGQVANSLGDLTQRFNEVSHLLNKDVWDENETKQVQDFLKVFKQVSSEVKNEKRNAGAAFFDEAQLSKVHASLNKVRELVAQYPKILSDPRFKTWYESFNNIDFDNLEVGKINIEKLTREMADFESQAKQAGLATQTLGQRFQTIAKNAALGNIAQTLLTEIKQLGREAYENVKELDKAMVELKKVTDETSATYSQFFENAKTQAKEVGSSLSDAITATADFARLGYSIGEAADLAKASQIYYNVGDGFNSITEASESVISTMKAFGIETQDVMRIVDAFNTTGNNFAISTQGVGEAMKRSASALAAAGNDMYESIALITAANSVVQDPASVGTALKTKVCLDVQKCAS